MVVKHILCIGTILLSVMSLVGCGGEDVIPTYPVTGTVTQKGKPISGAIVAFTPVAGGPAASGVTDAQGVYTLTTRSSGDGAVEGKYQVTVAKYDQKPPAKQPVADKETDPNDITNEYPDGFNEMQASEIAAAVSKNLLPVKYSKTATSKLEAEVSKKGKNNFDFQIE